MFETLSDDARRSVVLATIHAQEHGASAVGTDHLVVGIATGNETSAKEMLIALGATAHRLQASAGAAQQPAGNGALPMTANARTILGEARSISDGSESRPAEVTCLDLLSAIVGQPGCSGCRRLEELGVDTGGLRSLRLESGRIDAAAAIRGGRQLRLTLDEAP